MSFHCGTDSNFLFMKSKQDKLGQLCNTINKIK